ncbi:hypothetical protein BS47DRAFT_1368423 [Hydnum rufescens UP504]|uniref:Uncharacterized protein n=1 Tax=Hydnum rufescens UP504 TaxID=1448309 RepID=A0A9P6AFV8_9AGAM|nr:hypothetical protein BS47DRAFT_1368423 [Hydnum rufescens UP504]
MSSPIDPIADVTPNDTDNELEDKTTPEPQCGSSWATSAACSLGDDTPKILAEGNHFHPKHVQGIECHLDSLMKLGNGDGSLSGERLYLPKGGTVVLDALSEPLSLDILDMVASVKFPENYLDLPDGDPVCEWTLAFLSHLDKYKQEHGDDPCLHLPPQQAQQYPPLPKATHMIDVSKVMCEIEKNSCKPNETTTTKQVVVDTANPVKALAMILNKMGLKLPQGKLKYCLPND